MPIGLLLKSVVACVIGASLLPMTALAQTSETIDERSRWTIRVQSDVTIETSIVRVGDIAHLVGIPSAAWNRIASAPLALLPATGSEIVIDRQRLSRLVEKADAVPASIGWIGGDTIRVRRSLVSNRSPSAERESLGTESLRSEVPNVSAAAPVVQQASYTSPDGGRFSPDAPSVSVIDGLPPAKRPYTQIDHDRIERLMITNIRRMHPEIGAAYEIELATTPELVRLSDIGSIVSAEPIDSIGEGKNRFHVSLRTPRGPIDTRLTLQLTAHPKIVAASRSLPAGSRLSASDLKWISVPADRLPPASIANMDDLIGKETYGTLRAGAAIIPSNVGPPIVIRRGELIEVRVVGGGVTVSTNAKSLDDGSKSQLIEIETISPRKRLVARVVGTGEVEVVTRSPIVR